MDQAQSGLEYRKQCVMGEVGFVSHAALHSRIASDSCIGIFSTFPNYTDLGSGKRRENANEDEKKYRCLVRSDQGHIQAICERAGEVAMITDIIDETRAEHWKNSSKSTTVTLYIF